MLIRCDKCTTVYELDDRLIPPGGAPVQCSRCDHVFRAVREKTVATAPTGPVLVPPPRREEPPPERRLVGPTPAPPWSAGPAPTAAPAWSPDSKGRPTRKVSNPEIDGTTEDGPGLPPRKGFAVDVGPKKPTAGRWMIGAAVTLLVGLGIVGAVLRWQETAPSRPAPAPPAQPAVDPAAARARQEALELLPRGDATSLERAARLLDESLRKDPAPGVHADHALALALLALDAREERERLEGRARAADEQRVAAEAAGDAVRAAALARDVEGLRAGVAPTRERAARLAAEARGELEALPADRQRDPVALRAQAMALVAAGQRAEAARVAREVKGTVADPWLALAGILADLPENAGGEEHARALDRLDQLATAHPELVHARFLAARIRAGIGDTDGALAGLAGVLQANPDHLEAKRLKAEVAAVAAQAPPPAPFIGPPLPPTLASEGAVPPAAELEAPPAPPPENSGSHEGKSASQPARQ